MPQLSQTVFYAIPLRVHSFLKGVPLHDVWVDVPRLREAITFAAFLRTMTQGRSDRRLTAATRAPFRLRASLVGLLLKNVRATWMQFDHP